MKGEQCMWTHFYDMHSGGRQKEKQAHIYIEARDEEEAKVIFYNRFGHNPERVTCTCCGPDYAIDTEEDLEQLSGYQRGCQCAEYKNPDGTCYYRYLELPAKDKLSFHDYVTLEEYLESTDILVIPASEINPHECKGSVPDQGYVWI